MEASMKQCTDILEEMQETVRQQANDGMANLDDGEGADIQRALVAYKSALEEGLATFRVQAKGPAKDEALSKFLETSLLEGVQDWVGLLHEKFKVFSEKLRKESDTHKQKYAKIEGTLKAKQEVFDSRMEALEDQLKTSQERLTTERQQLNQMISTKESELKRALTYIEQLEKQQSQVSEKHSGLMKDKNEEIRTLRAKVDDARKDHVQDVKKTNKDMMDAERTNFELEKQHMQQQQSYMNQIVDLEKQLSQAQHDLLRSQYEMGVTHQSEMDKVKGQSEIELQEMTQKFQRTEMEAETLKIKTDALKAKLEDMEARHTAEVERLTAELTSASTKKSRKSIFGAGRKSRASTSKPVENKVRKDAVVEAKPKKTDDNNEMCAQQ